MRSAKMRNGRTVEFHGHNDITKHHTGSSDRTSYCLHGSSTCTELEALLFVLVSSRLS